MIREAIKIRLKQLWFRLMTREPILECPLSDYDGACSVCGGLGLRKLGDQLYRGLPLRDYTSTELVQLLLVLRSHTLYRPGATKENWLDFVPKEHILLRWTKYKGVKL